MAAPDVFEWQGSCLQYVGFIDPEFAKYFRNPAHIPSIFKKNREEQGCQALKPPSRSKNLAALASFLLPLKILSFSEQAALSPSKSQSGLTGLTDNVIV